MNLTDRINAFSMLGERLQSLSKEEKQTMKESAKAENPWFTEANVELALSGIEKFLKKEALTNWTSNYTLNSNLQKKVGVAMAGNIPLVGFHDLLSVLISGHTLQVKLSHQDTILMKTLISLLIDIEPKFIPKILIAERLNDVDGVIATGSDNTARYFEYYFRNIPHIIRKNRSSCAILNGDEKQEDLNRLGLDVFSYFGMGCRNVSKLYLPEGFDFSEISNAFEVFSEVSNHHKYMNNYDYQKALLVLNTTPFLDNGFSLMREEESLVSPLATLYYQYYSNQNDLDGKVSRQHGKIQCTTSLRGWYPKSVDFGYSQLPTLIDYADDVDTLKFLSNV